jgi:AcrR family transcriptional regulator
MMGTPSGQARGAGRTTWHAGYDLESLLEVAVDLFNERGYEATSMGELSRRLGITKSAIYHHVASKDELLRLAVGRALDALFDVVDEAAESRAPAVERLELLIRQSVITLARRLPFVTLLLRVRGNTEIEREALARRRKFDRIVTELVGRAQDEGDLRRDVEPAVIARLLFGMINSLVEWYRPKGGTTPEELADTVLAVAFDGLRQVRG